MLFGWSVLFPRIHMAQLIGRRGWVCGGLCGSGRPLARRGRNRIRDDGRRGGVGGLRAIRPDTATHEHAAQKNHDGDDGGRHEQKDELLPVQLNLTKPFVGGHVFFSSPENCLSRCKISIGSGNTIVEFFSEAISVSVWR